MGIWKGSQEGTGDTNEVIKQLLSVSCENARNIASYRTASYEFVGVAFILNC